MVAEHLLELGHRDIAFVGGAAHLEHVQARLEAWKGALAAAGVRPGPVAHQSAEAAAVLDHRPTAVA